jgi:hypothetical protein
MRIGLREGSQHFAPSVRLTNMMKAIRRITACWLAVCGTAAILATGVYGQTNDPGSANVLTRTSTGATREYLEEQASSIDSNGLPPNVQMPGFYRPLLESMLRSSPTFRRQCLRIANESALSVVVRAIQGRSPTHARAVTTFTRRPNGGLSAEININPLDDDIELIAHEFEHVLEQLDDVDLAARAAVANSGVRVVSDGAQLFETARATKTGLKVAQEVRSATRRAD